MSNRSRGKVKDEDGGEILKVTAGGGGEEELPDDIFGYEEEEEEDDSITIKYEIQSSPSPGLLAESHAHEHDQDLEEGDGQAQEHDQEHESLEEGETNEAFNVSMTEPAEPEGEEDPENQTRHAHYEEEPEAEAELIDLEAEPEETQSYGRGHGSQQTSSSSAANTADIEHDHIFAKTSKPPRSHGWRGPFAQPQPQLLPKPPPPAPLASNNNVSLPVNFVFTTPDGKVYRLSSTSTDGIQSSISSSISISSRNSGQLEELNLCQEILGLGPGTGMESQPELDSVSVSLSESAELESESISIPITSTTELGLGQTVTLTDETENHILPELPGDEPPPIPKDPFDFMPMPPINPNQAPSYKNKDPRRPAPDSEVMKSKMLSITVPGGGCVEMQRYIYTQALCRVCLMAKESMISLFEELNVTERGQIENSRGPNTCNRFNIISALKTLLDIDVSYGDALPDHICVECLDSLTSFSEFRKKISFGQTKLSDIIQQVQGSNNPTVIPPQGVTDLGKANIYRHHDLISNVKEMLRTTKYSHNVVRYLPDRILEKIFNVITITVGYKSEKLKCLETYMVDPPFVKGWFCVVCRLTVHGSTTDFVNHFRVDHVAVDAEDVVFGCDLCNEHFPLRDKTGLSQSYGEHLLQHLFFYECDICQKRMPSAKSVWVHKRSAHPGDERAFKCVHCDKGFVKKSHLVTHMKTHLNPDERKTQLNWCKICGKGLTGSLTVHMSTVHSEAIGSEPRWKCEICSKQFKKKENLIMHRNSVHHGMRKFQCDLCDETFKSHSTKTLHMLRHKGIKPHKCEVCDKNFLSLQALKSHLLIHNNGVGAYTCKVCKKCFKRKVYLAEHSKIHEDTKPHDCPHPGCGKSIRMKSNWYKHLKVHERRDKKRLLEEEKKAQNDIVMVSLSSDLDLD